MDLKDILSVAWKRRLTIAIVTIVALVIAGLIAFTATKQYQASESLALSPNTSTQFQGGQVGINALAALMPTYGTEAESPSVKAAAATTLGHPLGATISSSTTAGTGILQILASGPNPAADRTAASAVSGAFIARLGTKQVLRASVIAPATLPTSPVSPKKSIILGGGLLLGLALGFAFALALEQWFDKVSDAGEVTAATGLACLGLLPRNRALDGGGPSSLIWSDDPELFRLQEAMRSLRTTLQLSMDAESPVLQITSPSAGDGKSTVAANLAIAIANVGVPTVLVDADFWAPRQHLIFGLSNARGLSGAMSGDRRDSAKAPLQRTPFRDLRVLTSGPLPSNPTELIAAGIDSVLERLRRAGRVIIIDTPPVLAISDSRLIAAQVDSVVVVARAGQTKSSVLRAAVDQLQLAQSHVAGVVLNVVQKLPPEQVPSGGYYMRPADVRAATGTGRQPQPLVLSQRETSRGEV